MYLKFFELERLEKMRETEANVVNQLLKLKRCYSMIGAKAEFEAEGSTFNDIVRLRRLTLLANVELHLKVGGVEALRDIRDAVELGVDGIIAPMVESKFGAKKFFDSIQKVLDERQKIETTLNIETKTGLQNLDEILDYANNRFDAITIGRSDLTSSYFDPSYTQDSDYIFEKIIEVGEKVRQTNMKLNVGGGLSQKSICKINTDYPEIKTLCYKLETRKVMLPTQVFCNQEEAIAQSLYFEELYILSKKDFFDLRMDAELARLTELRRRL